MEILLSNCKVFARMKPDDKKMLVKQLQTNQLVNKTNMVGMCGDGANDCAALKAADIGVSLSEAEASIAAPFTSKRQDISCIIKLMREGKCALVTSVQCFKYMIIYSMIQFFQVLIFYAQVSGMSNNQFLYQDLFLVFPIAIYMGYTKASKVLSKEIPEYQLFSRSIISQIFTQIFLHWIFQVFVIKKLLSESNITQCYELEDGYPCSDNTSGFVFGNFQYIMSVFIYSQGKPFRREMYTNKILMILVIIHIFLLSFIAFDPNQDLTTFLDLFPLSIAQRVFIFIMIVVNFILNFGFEHLFFPYLKKKCPGF